MKSLLKKLVIFILTLEARLVLKKYKPHIVAVIGSVGKTTTKDAIFAVLEPHLFARKSTKSYNSEIGVPLAILGSESGWGNAVAWLSILFEGILLIVLKNHYPEWLVLEVGVDHPHDMERIAAWLSPDILVVTRFGDVPVHLEFFRSREELIEEKKRLVQSLRENGILVLNADDPDVLSLRKEVQVRAITYGIREHAMIHGTNPEIMYNRNGKPQGMSIKAEYKGGVFPVRIEGTLGIPILYSALGAFATGIALEYGALSIIELLAEFQSPRGRMRIITGMNDSLIVDDSYNSSPAAAKEALITLKNIQTEGQRIAVLGGMLELGKESAHEHKKIGAYAAEVSDFLVTVGTHAEFIADGARAKKMRVKNMKHFPDSEKAGKFLRDFVKEGDIILVKGSQSIRMEKIVRAIMAEPERAKELLVRQEKEWENR